jgi:lipopolysaccharide biosynthesis glycosyltransferase
MGKPPSNTPPVRPIVFTIDNRYVRPLAVALASLDQCCRSRRPVIVVHECLHPLHRWILARRHRQSHLDLRFVRLRLPAVRPQLSHHFSSAILLRLIAAPLIDAPVFIYVDADVLFAGDPCDLDRIDLQETTLAAVPWRHPRDLSASGHGVLSPYFASGMLVIDRSRFLAERIGECCLELIGRHRFDFPDQDALNLCCTSWQALPQHFSRTSQDQGELLLEEPDATLLLQFAGAEKPWHPFNRHPYRVLFRRWLRRTPYRFFPPGWSDLRWRSLGSRLAQRLLGGSLLRRWFTRS